MTFDESNAAITEHTTGRTIENVERKGKQLIIYTTCGHKIQLRADVNGDIQFDGCGVHIVLPGLSVGSAQGFIK